MRGQSEISTSRWLDRAAAEHGSRRALTAWMPRGARGLDYEAFAARAEAVAAWLEALGLRRGDAIALWLPTGPDWFVLHFAAVRAGLLTVPLNTWYRASEVEHLLGSGSCRLLVLDSAFRGIDFSGSLAAALTELEQGGDSPLEWILDLGEPSNEVAPAHSLVRLDPEAYRCAVGGPADDDPDENPRAIVFGTSGTTSAPKLAIHREGALTGHAERVAAAAGLLASDRVLCVLPPCGAYGHGLVLAALAAGAEAILMEDMDFDAAIEAIQVNRVTVFAATEPILRRLFDHPRAGRDTLGSLRVVFSAGVSLNAVVTRAEEEFGIPVTNVYGASELLALTSFWGLDEAIPVRSVGGGHLADPDARVRAVDRLTDEVLEPGQEGELQFIAPSTMEGYLGNAEATEAAFAPDHWYRSQDLGTTAADGRSFHYISRSTDLLRLKGFLVNPGEIEEILLGHAEVEAAQVVGIPDPSTGEDQAIAFVILLDGAGASAATLIEHCRRDSASYKAPVAIEIVEEFPITRSANGDKVIKHRLREMAEEVVAR